MVHKAKKMVLIPPSTNIHQLIFTWYAKFSSHLFIINQASGVAIAKAISSKTTKSLDNNITMPETEEPNTLRIPISFTRRLIINSAKANKPRQEMTIATVAPPMTIREKRCSVLYMLSVFSSKYEGLILACGFTFFQICSTLLMLSDRLLVFKRTKIYSIGKPTCLLISVSGSTFLFKS